MSDSPSSESDRSESPISEYEVSTDSIPSVFDISSSDEISTDKIHSCFNVRSCESDDLSSILEFPDFRRPEITASDSSSSTTSQVITFLIFLQ